MTDQPLESIPSEVSASKLLEDSELRHIAGRLKYAMDWVMTLKANPIGLTTEQRGLANVAVYRSAADVAPLLGDVGLLRMLLNSAAGYLIELVQDEKAEAEAKIVALTTLGLMQIEVGAKDFKLD